MSPFVSRRLIAGARLRRQCGAMLLLAACTLPHVASAAISVDGDVQFGGATLGVGVNSDGALTVTPPDTVTYPVLSVGQNPSAVGEVVIDGAQLNVLDEARIGQQGVGEVRVIGGGRYVQENGRLELAASGFGSLEAAGEGSLIDLTGTNITAELNVGGDQSFGRGEITVRDGGELRTGRASFRSSVPSNVWLTGEGSRWVSTGPIDFGSGDLRIDDGAALIVTDGPGLNVGDYQNAATLTVSGQRSSLIADRVSLGAGGDAFVKIDSGADVFAAVTYLGATSVGVPPSNISSMELHGFGTSWITQRLEFLRGRSESRIAITDGARLVTTEDRGLEYLGGYPSPGTRVTVTLDGPASRWISSTSELIIGGNSGSVLQVTGGARHTRDSIQMYDSTSSLIISGPGSEVVVESRFTTSGGRIELSDGGSLNLANTFTEAQLYNSDIRLKNGHIISPVGRSPVSLSKLSGDGVVELPVELLQNGEILVGAGETLSIHSLTNHGVVRVDNGTMVLSTESTNIGTIELNGYTRLLSGVGGSELVNQGNLHFESGTAYTSKLIRNAGSIVVGPGVTATFAGPVVRASEDASIVVEAGAVASFEAGLEVEEVLGRGTVVLNSSLHTISWRNGLDLETDLVLGDDSQIRVQASTAPTQSITSQQSVTLGGRISVFDIAAWSVGTSQLTIVEAASVEGQFDEVPDLNERIGSRSVFSGMEYFEDRVVMNIERFAPGDLNADGFISSADYEAWVAAFGTDDWRADGNGNGIVDIADYTLWRDAYQSSPRAVPEPMALVLNAVACALCCRRISR